MFQVRVYVGVDPVTGERVDLTGTAPTEREADKLLTKFLAEKDARRAARSRVTAFGAVPMPVRPDRTRDTRST